MFGIRENQTNLLPAYELARLGICALEQIYLTHLTEPLTESRPALDLMAPGANLWLSALQFDT